MATAHAHLKAARFGSVRALFDTYDYRTAHGIGAYGGGMFEQSPWRGQLQYLASLFLPPLPDPPGSDASGGRLTSSAAACHIWRA